MRLAFSLVSALLFLAAFPILAENEGSIALDEGDFATLAVPFVLQDPFALHEWPWGDFCEEASVVMAHYYLKGKNPTVYEGALSMLKLAIWEMNVFGYEKDTGLQDTQRMFHEYYGDVSTRIAENPTADDLRSEIRKGNLVIVPAAGKLLNNPYFKNGGPRYHMFVIKGFDGNEFIVNEPGTRRGESFRYSEETVMNAMHDLVPGNILTGRKAVLVIGKK